MLSDQERQWVHHHAFLPEHLPDYVAAVSGAEPFLHRKYLYFYGKKHLIFNGYPLVPEAEPPAQIYNSICERLQPLTAAVIAPRIWLPEAQCDHREDDRYFRLDLPLAALDGAVAYMLRRARRDLRVVQGQFGKEHKKIIKAFLARHRFNRRQKYIFKHIVRYLKACDSAMLFEARKEKDLAAFSIVDMGAMDFAFYLFSFRSGKLNAPGASDLLFQAMVDQAQIQGKRAINLGLGVNDGIRRFKEKWGGVPFLDYCSVQVDNREIDIGSLAKKL